MISNLTLKLRNYLTAAGTFQFKIRHVQKSPFGVNEIKPAVKQKRVFSAIICDRRKNLERNKLFFARVKKRETPIAKK